MVAFFACGCFLSDFALFGLEETRGGGVGKDGRSNPPCFLPVTDDAAEDGEGEVDMGDPDCVQGALDKLDRAGMPCPCSVSCEQEEFDKTVTVASWPSDLYWVRQEKITACFTLPAAGSRRWFAEDLPNIFKEPFPALFFSRM